MLLHRYCYYSRIGGLPSHHWGNLDHCTHEIPIDSVGIPIILWPQEISMFKGIYYEGMGYITIQHL